MSIHNLRFLIRVVEGARLAIEEKRFELYRQHVLSQFGSDKGF
jgi:queuine/archaeosine tRNA-ribosyltransferase